MTISLIEVALDQPSALRPYAAREFGGIRSAVTTVADVWSGVASLRAVPTAAGTLTVVSASAADTAGGTGARSIELTGLDGDGVEQTEDIVLAGLTPVASLKSWLRVNECRATSAGSGGVNAGAITVTHVAGVIAFISAGEGVTSHAGYSVPAGRAALILAFRAQGEDINKTPDATLYERVGITGTTPVMRGIAKILLGDRATAIDYRAYHYVEGPADIFVRCSSDQASRIAAQVDLLVAVL